MFKLSSNPKLNAFIKHLSRFLVTFCFDNLVYKLTFYELGDFLNNYVGIILFYNNLIYFYRYNNKVHLHLEKLKQVVKGLPGVEHVVVMGYVQSEEELDLSGIQVSTVSVLHRC